jgi:lysozyme family protein
MADFQQSLERTLRFEDATLSGVITYDTGGATRFGISQNACPEVFPVILDDSVAGALMIAGEIYRERYWLFDDVTLQPIADKLFDMAVNMGLGTAVMMAQRCVGTTPDGKWGPITLQAVNDATGLLQCLRSVSAQHYTTLAEEDPAKYGSYLKGWLARAAA